MDPLIFDIKYSELIMSSVCESELKYLASVNPISQKISVSSGGEILDYAFEIYVRGGKDKFEMPLDRVGRMLSTVKIDVENKIPMRINLNVSEKIIKELINCHYSSVRPKKIIFSFNEDEWNDSWDNLCKFRIATNQEKNLFFVEYKFEI